MGVVYTLRVVEDETVELGFHHGERFQDEERSWVESVNCPEARQVVVDDGSRGGTVEDDGDGAGEDFLPQQITCMRFKICLMVMGPNSYEE
jgi:hypothetical protein